MVAHLSTEISHLVNRDKIVNEYGAENVIVEGGKDYIKIAVSTASCYVLVEFEPFIEALDQLFAVASDPRGKVR
jgi:hypothetical protein